MPGGNPMYPPDVLEAKAKEASDGARQALIFAIIGVFCLGLIFGILAFRKANHVIGIIDQYQVAQDKRGVAMGAKILGLIDVVLWALILILRVFMR